MKKIMFGDVIMDVPTRARGTHQIIDMSKLVLDLVRLGNTDEEIAKNLGMDQDEVLRLKQISGLKEAFGSRDFSKSWIEYNEKIGEPTA